jgi:lipid II:glycine glycyltransferase (peptidoglycan interpeptide bridge formation enzyme)
MIWEAKGAAYDASVAVDPDWQHEHVSHILKWKAIEHLQGQGAESYELGRIAVSANVSWQPSDKNYGISFFKEGWARDGQKIVHEASRFFDSTHLSAWWNECLTAVAAHQKVTVE